MYGVYNFIQYCNGPKYSPSVAVFFQLSCPWVRVQESMHFYVCSYRLVSWGPPPALASRLLLLLPPSEYQERRPTHPPSTRSDAPPTHIHTYSHTHTMH